LHEEYDLLETSFQKVTVLNSRFRRVARERIDYLDEQLQLAELIGKLVETDKDQHAGLKRYVNHQPMNE
jgi:hypothetical protein